MRLDFVHYSSFVGLDAFHDFIDYFLSHGISNRGGSEIEQSLNRKLKNLWYVQLGNGLYSIKNSGGDKAVVSEGGDFTPIRVLKGVHQNEAVVSFSNEMKSTRTSSI